MVFPIIVWSNGRSCGFIVKSVQSCICPPLVLWSQATAFLWVLVSLVWFYVYGYPHSNQILSCKEQEHSTEHLPELMQVSSMIEALAKQTVVVMNMKNFMTNWGMWFLVHVPVVSSLALMLIFKFIIKCFSDKWRVHLSCYSCRISVIHSVTRHSLSTILQCVKSLF